MPTEFDVAEHWTPAGEVAPTNCECERVSYYGTDPVELLREAMEAFDHADLWTDDLAEQLPNKIGDGFTVTLEIGDGEYAWEIEAANRPDYGGRC